MQFICIQSKTVIPLVQNFQQHRNRTIPYSMPKPIKVDAKPIPCKTRSVIVQYQPPEAIDCHNFLGFKEKLSLMPFYECRYKNYLKVLRQSLAVMNRNVTSRCFILQHLLLTSQVRQWICQATCELVSLAKRRVVYQTRVRGDIAERLRR
jgi:hypothetical protein